MLTHFVREDAAAAAAARAARAAGGGGGGGYDDEGLRHCDLVVKLWDKVGTAT